MKLLPVLTYSPIIVAINKHSVTSSHGWQPVLHFPEDFPRKSIEDLKTIHAECRGLSVPPVAYLGLWHASQFHGH